MSRLNRLHVMALFTFALGFSSCLQQGKVEGEDSTVVAVFDQGSSGGPSVDLRDLSVGTSQTLVFELDDGGCECALASSGNEYEGGLRLSSCRASTGSVNPPDCSVMADNYRFTVQNSTLTVCDSQNRCSDY